MYMCIHVCTFTCAFGIFFRCSDNSQRVIFEQPCKNERLPNKKKKCKKSANNCPV